MELYLINKWIPTCALSPEKSYRTIAKDSPFGSDLIKSFFRGTWYKERITKLRRR